jgi:alkylhydroperoxidase/carboxymuconolactone decarboxylase family protein YurZ
VTTVDELQAEFEQRFGYWDDSLATMLHADPRYFAAYLRLNSVPFETNRIPAGDRELISVAINAAATHLNREAVQLHVDRALRLGVPREQIIEASQLASVLGTHTMSRGVPLLLEEMERAGKPIDISEEHYTAAQVQLKEQFVEDRGYWVAHWGAILQFAPEYFGAYLEFSSVPWLQGTLEPKLREFIYVAIDASTTHLYDLGMRVHTRNALGYGATFEELLDVMVITSLLGMQSSLISIPYVVDADERS